MRSATVRDRSSLSARLVPGPALLFGTLAGTALARDGRSGSPDRLVDGVAVLATEPLLDDEALVSRPQTARALRLLRRYQRQLRHRAIVLGRRVSREKPRHFVRRIKRLWRPARIGGGTAVKRVPWTRAA